MREVVDGKTYDVSEAKLLCRVFGGPTVVPSMGMMVTLAESVYVDSEGEYFVVETQTHLPHDRSVQQTTTQRLKPISAREAQRQRIEAQRQVEFGQ